MLIHYSVTGLGRGEGVMYPGSSRTGLFRKDFRNIFYEFAGE